VYDFFYFLKIIFDINVLKKFKIINFKKIKLKKQKQKKHLSCKKKEGEKQGKRLCKYNIEPTIKYNYIHMGSATILIFWFVESVFFFN
jgi:hypothetical protein